MSAVHTDSERELDRELAAAVSRGHRADPGAQPAAYRA